MIDACSRRIVGWQSILGKPHRWSAARPPWLSELWSDEAVKPAITVLRSPLEPSSGRISDADLGQFGSMDTTGDGPRQCEEGARRLVHTSSVSGVSSANKDQFDPMGITLLVFAVMAAAVEDRVTSWIGSIILARLD
ncbi:hypothetical protein [Nocardia brasiliensis]|uniref:hypothetical protein n=1 Tax=Nocardia brasiliensis TaxID=37326 RepID=UPI0024569310|nr:hypothetical protein [Nocardia brasiliensis]